MPYNEHWSGWRRLRRGGALCTCCLAQNERFRDFCWRCATPITTHAEIDPLGQVYARGEAYRKAIAHPSRIGVIGMWLICGPTLLTCLGGYTGLTIGAFDANTPVESLGVLGAALFIVGGGYLAGGILYRVTRNYIVAGKSHSSLDAAARKRG
jgi:hypothetical protein